MLFRIDHEAGAPLYAQVMDCVLRAIEGGQLRTGDRLPPAREVAAGLGVNMHTVLRAYSELQEAGVIDLRRRTGAVVRSTRVDEGRLNKMLEALVAEATRLGLSTAELVRRLENA